MKSIKTFKQFNESYSSFNNDNIYQYDPEELHLSKEEELKIKNKTSDTLNSMSDFEKSKVVDELEKLTTKFGCKLEDLTNPVFVKEFLDREILLKKKEEELEGVKEGFGDYIKEKIIRFFSIIFQIGGPLAGLFMIISSAVNSSFWGVVTGAMALTISILASAYISSKIFK